MSESYKEFTEALTEIERHDVCYEILEALDTLLVYCYNLYTKPFEAKFHLISFINIHFQERLGHIPGSVRVMNTIGYTKGQEVYEYNRELLQPEVFPITRTNLEKIIHYLEKRRQVYHCKFSTLHEPYPDDHQYSAVIGCGFSCDQGRRGTMEDAEIVIDKFYGSDDSAFFGVYDGHGGRETVDFVVRSLHSNVISQLRSRNITPKDLSKQPADVTYGNKEVLKSIQLFGDVFQDSYKNTDSQIRRSSILRSGTTAVTCLITYINNRKYLFVANVGDSRAVLFRDGGAIRLTIDHKANLKEEADRVVKAGGFVSPSNRVNGVLAITRALGDHTLKENEVVTYRPHVHYERLQEKDCLLVLACDGLWDVISDYDALYLTSSFVARETFNAVYDLGMNADELTRQFAHKTKDEELTPQDKLLLCKLIKGEKLNKILKKVSKTLVSEALRKGSHDNITAMVIIL